MNKPRIYVHRLGSFYPLYMDAANESLLLSFADAVLERGREEPFAADELVERMRGCSAILSLNGMGAGEITAEVLRRVGTVKLICIAHYWEHFTETARQAGIACIEGSNANTLAVAEWTLAAILMGVRRLHGFDRALKAGSPWGEPRRGAAGLLRERIVGLIGLGRIGWYVAQCLKPMGVRIIVFDQDRTKIENLGLEAVGLDELLSTADVVSLHLPVTPATKGLLGAREFARLKDGAVFINSARAALTDEPALVAELKKNRFSAFLDVFAAEPLPPDHPFRSMDNVVITPHIAGDNAAMFLRCGREAILTLKDFVEGKGAVNRQYTFP